MPDEVGTETIRSDAPSADDSLFGEAPDDEAAADVEAEDANEDAPRVELDAGDADKQTDLPEELKVVVSIKGTRTTIGVQRPSSDPHIESFSDHDLLGLAREVPAVTERARARWEDALKHPVYERPAPPARHRSRRQQESAQDTATSTEAEERQQTLRLF